MSRPILPACALLLACVATVAAPGPDAPPQTPDRLFQELGAGHTSVHLSSPYPDGGRVLWTGGESVVAKLDAATFDVIATLRRAGAPSDDGSRRGRLTEILESDRPAAERLRAAASEGWRPPAPAGSILDAENRLLVPEGRSIAAYADAEPGTRLSGIRVVQRFTLPASIPGRFGRLTLTRDGHVVAATSAGGVVALARGFSRLTTLSLPHAPGKEDASAWVRGGPVVDDRDGVYITSARHLHRVVWNGSNLSVAAADGAWSEPWHAGFVGGATPSLVGSGAEGDRLVAIVAGDPPSTLLLLWRDAGPDGPASKRIAAVQEIGFAAAPVLVTAGDGILAVAASPPLPLEPSPGGLANWIWDPRTRALRPAWSAGVSGAVSGTPLLTRDVRVVAFVAFRDGRSTLEGIDWESGASILSRPLGGVRSLAPGAVPILDPEGRFVAGSLFGVTRIGLPR